MKMRTISTLVTITLGALLLAACGGGERRTVIQNKGSDTLVNVAQAWAEAYQKVNPAVVVAVSGGGSGTGIAALINGTVDIANASREIKPSEIEEADKNGHHPVQHVVGYDAMGIFLNRNNPIDQISLQQLKEIYVDGGSYTHWTDLGVEVPGCQDQVIVVVSRQNSSGTYAYFREAVLGEEDYRLGTRDMHGSKDVVDLVENTPCAIGYSGLAYATDRVKMPCVSKGPGSPCVMASEKTAVDGSYPIARPLFMYSSGEPTGHVKEYLDWIKGHDAQCIITRMGYAPAAPIDCG